MKSIMEEFYETDVIPAKEKETIAKTELELDILESIAYFRSQQWSDELILKVFKKTLKETFK